MSIRLLIVDDEPGIRTVVGGTLRRLGMDVCEVSRGEEAIPLVTATPFDAVLLDCNMPGIGGLATCRALRKAVPSLAILMLTVRDSESDKVRALDAGADDYVTKPFSVRELVARVKAVLRRTNPAEDAAPRSFRLGDFEICQQQRTFLKRGESIRLTATEFDLLHHLMSHNGKVVTYPKLLSAVWGIQFRDDVQYLRTYMRQLRKKIEDEPARPRYLLTEPYIGYRFQDGVMHPLAAKTSAAFAQINVGQVSSAMRPGSDVYHGA